MAVSDLNILPVYRGGLIKINTGDYSCLYSCAVVIQLLIETAVEHIKEFKINSGYQYTGIMIYTISGSPLLIVLDCIYDITGMFVLVGGENFIAHSVGSKS